MIRQLLTGLTLAALSQQATAYPVYSDGDVAPLGSPDGLVNTADYLVMNRIVTGELAASDLELGHGDIYPQGNPDGIVNTQDLLLLKKWALGEVAIDAYREILDIYNDGPATESATAGGNTGSTTLVTGGYVGPGAVVTNDAFATDPVDSSNTAWHFSVTGGVANIFIGTPNLDSDPVLDTGFDVSGAANAKLVFDIYVVSIDGSTDLTVKMDSGYPNLGQYTLNNTEYTVGSWRTVSVDLATLLANPGPGSGLDVHDVLNAFVLEVTNGSADVYIDNIFFMHSCGAEGDCNATVNTKPVFQLVWSDEFNGTSVNTDNWVYDLGYGSFGWGNDEWQLYTNNAANVNVSGGTLKINALCSNPPNNCNKRDGTITSSRIKTLGKMAFRYGKIEARIKAPVGDGAWSAFWMLGANFPTVGWPQSGEIDVMEIFTGSSNGYTTHSTVHYCNDYVSNPCQYSPGWQYSGNSLFTGDLLDQDFHIYSAEWNKDQIIFSFDGTPVYVHNIDPGNMDEFRKEFFVILNVAIGGTLGGAPNSSTPWPQTMEVDYVRIYQDLDDSESTLTIPGQIPQAENAGIYSETHTDPTVPYVQIINSNIWGGNSTTAAENSTQVTPFDGTYVLDAHFQNTGQSYGGFVYELGSATDVSDFTTIKFAIDTSAIPAFDDMIVQIENQGGGQPAPKVFLSSYTPTISGNWAEYEIPLVDFTGQTVALDLTSVYYIGFWNPQNVSNSLVYGHIYFDNIHLAGGTPP